MKTVGMMNMMNNSKAMKKTGHWFKRSMTMMGIGLLALGMTACTASAPKTTASASETEAVVQDHLSQIKANGKIVLGTSADYPPYEFHKTIDGKDTIIGFDVAIAKAIADDLGVDLEIVDMKFEGLLPALTGGKIDFIVAGMNPTEERKKSVSFSNEYYEAHQTMIVSAEQATTLTTIESFSGKTVGVQKGTIQENLANEKFVGAKVEAIGKIPDLIMALKAGKIDGIILAETVAKSYVSKNSDLSLNGLDLGSEGGVAIAMPLESLTLVESVNKSLQTLMDSGKIDAFITEANEQVN